MEPLRDEDDDDEADKDDDDDEDSSASGISPTRARFSGEASLSDSEADSNERFVGVERELKTLSVPDATSATGTDVTPVSAGRGSSDALGIDIKD